MLGLCLLVQVLGLSLKSVHGWPFELLQEDDFVSDNHEICKDCVLNHRDFVIVMHYKEEEENALYPYIVCTWFCFGLLLVLRHFRQRHYKL